MPLHDCPLPPRTPPHRQSLSVQSWLHMRTRWAALQLAYSLALPPHNNEIRICRREPRPLFLFFFFFLLTVLNVCFVSDASARAGQRTPVLVKGKKTHVACLLEKAELPSPTEQDSWAPSASFGSVVRAVRLLRREGDVSLKHPVLGSWQNLNSQSVSSKERTTPLPFPGSAITFFPMFPADGRASVLERRVEGSGRRSGCWAAAMSGRRRGPYPGVLLASR